jgi:F-type H+-transporting ATPase subunit a
VSTRPVAININPGEHTHWVIGGVTFNSDTIIGTLVAGAVILLIALLIRRGGSVAKPTKLQLAFEMIVTEVRRQVDSTLGIATAPFVVPMAFTIFVFILISNWIAFIPTGNHPEYVPPPTADVNLTYALALTVIVTMHVTGIRKQGVRKYYAHIFRKPYALVPLNIIEEIMKPITLALRLFGNIFSGTIMVALIAALPAFVLWAPTILWKLFDGFIGLIQAFIFGLLTVLYFGSVKPHEEGAPAH